MGVVRIGEDRLIAPDMIVAALADAVGRLLRLGCFPFVLSFEGPEGRHNLLITAETRLEMIVADRGPVFAQDATVNALVETTMTSGKLVLDLAAMDELDIDLMRSRGDD